MAEAPEISDAEFDAGKFFTPLQKRILSHFDRDHDPCSLEKLAKSLAVAPDALKEGLSGLEEVGLIESKLIEGRDFYRGKPGPA